MYIYRRLKVGGMLGDRENSEAAIHKGELYTCTCVASKRLKESLSTAVTSSDTGQHSVACGMHPVQGSQDSHFTLQEAPWIISSPSSYNPVQNPHDDFTCDSEPLCLPASLSPCLEFTGRKWSQWSSTIMHAAQQSKSSNSQIHWVHHCTPHPYLQCWPNQRAACKRCRWSHDVPAYAGSKRQGRKRHCADS